MAQAETGLVATYSAGKTTVRRVVPTPSFTLAVDESVHPQISPEFEAVYEGALKIVRGGEYRFSGDARIEVDGQDVAGKALKLTTGERAIKITYLRKPGPARLQVRWQSDFFIDEPIPASAYAYAKKQEDDLTKLWASIEHGRLLYENLNCGSCHGADEWNLSSRQGPDLSAVGSRVSGDWLQAWLKDPKHYRKSTSMPALLTSDGEVRDVTAFLLSLAKALADEADTPNAGRIEAGKELFNEVGCAKCHGEANHSLTEVGGKYRSSQALARYLLDPLQVDPNGRMPQFFDSKTQAHEAALVAEYLFHGKSRDWPKFSGGDAFRGRKIVQARGCAACHSVKFDDQILPNRLVAPQFTKKNAPPDAQKGCLAETPPAGAPNYRLEVADRVGLQDFLQSLVTAAVVAKAPVETFHRRLSQFNCAACHSATAQANPADAAFFALERPPSLDGAGAKLQVNWIRRVLLEGKRTRPWMKMRMPHFGGAVESLPALFPLSSGSQPVDEVPIPDKKVAAVGLQAVAICVSCHDYRDVNRQQEGVVPAPNLAEVGETLRLDWFRRWIHDPQRMRTGASMPQFFAELKGKERMDKVDALWATLYHQKSLPLPEGLADTRVAGTQVVVGNDPVVFRVATKLTSSLQIDRAINVGLPGGTNYTFDAATARLRGAWKGEFINASPAWNGRGGKPVNVVTEAMFVPINHFPLRIGSQTTEPKVRFLGYFLKEKHPVFRYAVDGVEVHERIEVTDREVIRGFSVADASREVFFVDDEERKYADATGLLKKGVLRMPAGKNLAFELRRPLPVGKTTVKAVLAWVEAGNKQAPKSRNGNYTAIIFENKSGRPVKLVWVSYDGDLQPYGQLAPGVTRTQNTYSNNTWLITDPKDKHLGYFIATPQVSKALIPAPK